MYLFIASPPKSMFFYNGKAIFAVKQFLGGITADFTMLNHYFCWVVNGG
jgi:hypothetical protein